ncbi:MAG: class I SAM-dependent methyltransferase [Candidatus Bathyarchaeia archaeon]
MVDRTEDLQAVYSVEGWLSAPECSLLYDLASQVSSGCIVEVGSYRGRSTVALAKGSLANGGVPVYAIDPHDQFIGAMGWVFTPKDRIAFLENILRTQVAEIVHIVNLSSEVVVKGWREEVKLLWIDGDHRYEAVKRDLNCWTPFVSKECPVAFHDSTYPGLGPSKVIAESMSSGRFTLIRQVDLTTVLEKCD